MTRTCQSVRTLPFLQLKPNICCRVSTVREFAQLAWHAAGYPHMQQRLQPLLGLTLGRWDAACQHAKAAVQVSTLLVTIARCPIEAAPVPVLTIVARQLLRPSEQHQPHCLSEGRPLGPSSEGLQ